MPRSASRWQSATTALSRNCTSSTATSWVSGQTAASIARASETASAVNEVPSCVRITVVSQRVSSADLNTWTRFRACIARRTRRISSSVLPENMLPHITVTEPRDAHELANADSFSAACTPGRCDGPSARQRQPNPQRAVSRRHRRTLGETLPSSLCRGLRMGTVRASSQYSCCHGRAIMVAYCQERAQPKRVANRCPVLGRRDMQRHSRRCRAAARFHAHNPLAGGCDRESKLVPEAIEQRIARLVEALQDQHVSAAWNAARELARLGAAAAAALPALEAALHGKDPTTALWARYALAQIRGDVEAQVPYFVAALEQKRRIWAGMAATALSGFGPVAAAAVPALTADLTSPRTDDRWAAAWALGSIGPAATGAEPALRAALGDADEKVRWYAANALRQIGARAPETADALTMALDDIDDDVRSYAVLALAAMGPLSAEARERVRSLAADDNPHLREIAEEALQRDLPG